MTTEHHERLYAILRGPVRCADDKTELLFDVMAMEELEQLRPVIQDIEQQAEARARFQCLLELAWTLKQATSLFTEAVH